MEPSRLLEDDSSQWRETGRAEACERKASRRRLGLVAAFLVMLGLSGAFVWCLAVSESIWTVEFHAHFRFYSLKRLENVKGRDIRSKTEIHLGPFALSASHAVQKLASASVSAAKGSATRE